MSERAIDHLIKRKNKELDSDAGVQRRKLLTREERHREAIDKCTERHVNFERRNGNSNVSAAAVRQTYVDMARRVDKTGGKG